jgi:DNA modification methylase
MQIKLSDIKIPETVKKDEKYELIKKSIEEHGLFHQVLLQGTNPPYSVLAGRRRLAVFQDLGRETIEAEIFPEGEAREISLHENLRRNNLSWYDQVELEKELHDLRIQQHGPKKPGRPFAGVTEGWSKVETARELGLSVGGLHQDIELAEALLRNPELRNLKDKGTALRLIKQAKARRENEISALMPTDDMNQVYLGDSVDILKHLKPDTFDACITDPPWSEYKDEGVPQESLLPIFREIYRALKPNSFLYVITSSTDFYFYREKLTYMGFEIQKYPIIWHKTRTLTHGRAIWQYARDYEPILVAVKGKPSLAMGVETSSILTYENVTPSAMAHPHEKPVALLIKIMQQCTYQGANILDPFAGSGVVGQAAKQTGRNYILIEKDAKYYEQIQRRLKWF